MIRTDFGGQVVVPGDHFQHPCTVTTLNCHSCASLYPDWQEEFLYTYLGLNLLILWVHVQLYQIVPNHFQSDCTNLHSTPYMKVHMAEQLTCTKYCHLTLYILMI